jgi:serine phosphatase RsbU (regulator of sigma subunit)
MRLMVMCGDSDSDLLFKDARTCARHAEIVSQSDQFFVVTRGDNGLLAVNGRRVQGQARLHERDIVTVGDSQIHFRWVSPEQGDTEDERLPTPRPGTFLQEGTSDRIISVADFVAQSRALRTLSEATTNLLVHHPFPELFERLLDLVFEAVPADNAAIMLLESDRAVQKAGRDRAGQPAEPPLDPTLMGKVIEGRMAIMVGETNEGVSPDRAADKGGHLMCAPLWISRHQGNSVRVIGLLYAWGGGDREPFKEADLEILTVLANTAAAKIENAWLLEGTLEQRRLQQELKVAAEIQASLLPHALARIPGYDLAGRTQSSEAVGGDFYDLAYDGDLLHLALGDVAGKGVGAAMLMVELRSTVRANWQRGDLAEAATRINGHFHRNIPPDRYATFFLGRLNPQSGDLCYVNAGHNRPLLVGVDGRCETLGEGGTAFGAFAESSYDEAQVGMRPDDTLVVYSDGISDAWPEPGAADRELAEIVRSVGRGGAAQIEETIFAAVDRRTPSLPRDDRTLVVVKREAASSG